jgi:hypothetical protein
MISLVKRPGSCLARIAVSVGTLVWSCAVLLQKDALDATQSPFYAALVKCVDGYVLGWVGLALSAFSIYRIVTVNSLKWYEQIGYAVQAFLWTYIAAGLFVDPNNLAPPSEAGGVMVVAGLGLYAFISPPRNIHGSK